jgi:hypothetical protein
MAACCVLVVVGWLEQGLRVRDGVWGFGLAPTWRCVPAVGHDDDVIVVWRGDRGGLICRSIHAWCRLGVCSGGWELVPPSAIGWVPMVDRAAVERRGGLWGLVRHLVYAGGMGSRGRPLCRLPKASYNTPEVNKFYSRANK